MRSSSFGTRFVWGYYKSATVLEEFYLLHSVHGYSVIPKRAFGSASDTRGFEALLAAQLPIEDRVTAR